jgi:hypothetical protein
MMKRLFPLVGGDGNVILKHVEVALPSAAEKKTAKDRQDEQVLP